MEKTNRNKHYHETKINSLEVIDDWGLDFYLGNTVKYIQRSKLKGSEEVDIQKAIDYLVLYQKKTFDQ
jgi:hypothetical protein